MAHAREPLLQPLPEVSTWEVAPGYFQGRESEGVRAWDSSTYPPCTSGGERQLLRQQTDMSEGEISILQAEAVPRSQELTRCWMEWVSCCRKAPGSALPGGSFPPPVVPARG